MSDSHTSRHTAAQTLEDERRYWNKRAATFPRYTPGDDQYEARVLAAAREGGVDFRGKNIVDVGCGSGLHTLRLAQEASVGHGHVTALDLSDDMLAVLRMDAATHGIANIRTVRCHWMDFRPEQPCDIVFTSMCPAIRDDASRRKLLTLAGQWLVFVGFAGREPSDMLRGLYARHGITPKDFRDAPLMREWLDAQHEPYTVLPLTGQWIKEWSKEEAVQHCRTLLGGYGISPDADELDAHLASFQATGIGQKGLQHSGFEQEALQASGSEQEALQPLGQADAPYVERTPYAVEVIVWRRA